MVCPTLYAGFFHADKYNRPALPLDLVEEFRVPIVDSLVLTLVDKRLPGAEDFGVGRSETEAGSVKPQASKRDERAESIPPAAAGERARSSPEVTGCATMGRRCSTACSSA